MTTDKLKWIEIKCRCGRVGNYSATTSGKTPCSNPRCFHLLDVPVLNVDSGERITEADIEEIMGRR